MTDQPILMSAPMVRACLREIEQPGTGKTQTRRILKGAPTEPGWLCYEHADGQRKWIGPNGYPSMPCTLRFAVGDRLWVRETWAKPFAGPNGYIYRADGPEFNSPASAKHQWGAGERWRVSIHMPRVASRLTVTVTDVRVQRLQEISEADARAEGAMSRPGCYGYQNRDDGWSMDWSRIGRRSRWARNGKTLAAKDLALATARLAFANFWNKLNGDGSWENDNPWVVVLTFAVEARNIDAAGSPA